MPKDWLRSKSRQNAEQLNIHTEYHRISGKDWKKNIEKLRRRRFQIPAKRNN